MTKKRSSEFFGVKIDIFPKKKSFKNFFVLPNSASSLCQCAQLFIFLKSYDFRKCSVHLGYNNISRRFRDTHLTILHSKIPHPPPGLTPTCISWASLKKQ